MFFLGKSGSGARILKEVTLNDPIRYAINDPIEKWLNDLLLLEVIKKEIFIFFLSFLFNH